MNPKSFPLFSHLLVFILGIHLSFETRPLLILLDYLFTLGLILYFSYHPPWFRRNLIIAPCFLAFGFGIGTVDHALPTNHYSQSLSIRQENTFEFELVQHLRPTKIHERYYIKLKKCNDTKTRGLLLLLLAKDSLQPPLDYAKQWKVSGKITPLMPPSNPGQFDYAKYLKTLGIYHQLKGNVPPIPMNNKPSNILLQSKAIALEAIEGSPLKLPTKQLLHTLLLGERTMLNRESLQEYAQAGLAHLLAISGLHIGLLMLLFRWFLQPLRHLPKGQVFHHIGVIGLLWLYAFFVGGSPSVIRAVSLFSALQIGWLFDRKLPTTYLVLLSMAILLFVSPRLILHLGFQLSYLAVFGILFISPIFQVKFNSTPLRWFWNLTVVSLAAQIAVAPLTIYHFNQFPGMFLLSNWVVLPLIGSFLYLGFGSLIWLLFAPLPKEIIYLLDECVEQLNFFVQWINQQEAFLFSNIFINLPSLLLLYMLLVGFLLWRYLRNHQWVYWNGIVFIGLIYFLLIKDYQKKKALWLAHDFGTSILVEQQGDQIRFHSKTTIDEKSYVVQHYQKYFGLKKVVFRPLKNTYKLRNKYLYIIDGDWILQTEKMKPPYILLHNNPKFNLARYVENSPPELVLIDGSNSPYFIQQWKETLKRKKIPFHITGEKGAYSFNLESVE